MSNFFVDPSHYTRRSDGSWEQNEQGEQPGQGLLLNPFQGTGLSTDPDNRERRRDVVDRIVSHSSPRLATAMNESRIPLRDLQSAAEPRRGGLSPGLYATSETRQNLKGLLGAYWRRNHNIWVDDSQSMGTMKSVVAHEVGHALHINGWRSDKGGMYKQSGANAISEGVADGYADRYGYERPVTEPVHQYKDDPGARTSVIRWTR